mmetsp:Transcript_78697/g.238686  ORF Transcript_78697/g.238686 Transcript_78697/m.238686 type:complete len:221 (-) Transcript_78697:505-1167(-)
MRTQGMKAEAMVSCRGPVKTAEGRISPHMSTKVTESRTAMRGETSWSRKMGSASFATVLKSMSVTRSRWWSRTNGSTRSAFNWSLFNLSLACFVPQCSGQVAMTTVRPKGSSVAKPSVRPAAKAAEQTHISTQPRHAQKRNDSIRASSASKAGLWQKGRVSHFPFRAQEMVIVLRAVPQTKESSRHMSVYSRLKSVLPDQVPSSSCRAPQSLRSQYVPLS